MGLHLWFAAFAGMAQAVFWFYSLLRHKTKLSTTADCCVDSCGSF